MWLQVLVVVVVAATQSILAATAIDWSNITAFELYNLFLTVFVNITTPELSSIQPASCTGFKYLSMNILKRIKILL
jgi:hypothetical protein